LTATARVVSKWAAATAAAAEAPAGVEVSRSTWNWRPVVRHGRSRRSGLRGAVSASPYRSRSFRWYAVALGLSPGQLRALGGGQLVARRQGVDDGQPGGVRQCPDAARILEAMPGGVLW
jgi:hypothetical protein